MDDLSYAASPCRKESGIHRMKSQSGNQPARMSPRSGVPPERLSWLLQIAGWGGVGILSLYPLIQMFNPRSVAVILVLRVGSGILLTCGMRWVYRRIYWRAWPWWQLAVAVLSICLVLG